MYCTVYPHLAAHLACDPALELDRAVVVYVAHLLEHVQPLLVLVQVEEAPLRKQELHVGYLLLEKIVQ